jgi:hypothetical protein
MQVGDHFSMHNEITITTFNLIDCHQILLYIQWKRSITFFSPVSSTRSSLCSWWLLNPARRKHFRFVSVDISSQALLHIRIPCNTDTDFLKSVFVLLVSEIATMPCNISWRYRHLTARMAPCSEGWRC